MDNNEVVKKAIAAAAAKAGLGDVKEFLKKKGVEVTTPTPVAPEKESKREKSYCNGDCQKGVTAPRPVEVASEEKRLTPIWPIESETIEEWKAEDAKRKIEKEAFLKTLDTPEHLAKIRADALEAVSKMPSRYVPTSASTKRQEDKAEKREAKAKAKIEKKKSGRQNRLGQTKLIDELIKEGKSETDIFAAVRQKIPAYPADMLPKLIKLRQYHVKKL